jgi:hypothetical protein
VPFFSVERKNRDFGRRLPIATVNSGKPAPSLTNFLDTLSPSKRKKAAETPDGTCAGLHEQRHPLKRVAIFQIHSERFKLLFLRMSLPRNRFPLSGDMF